MIRELNSDGGSLQCPGCKDYRRLVFRKKRFSQTKKSINYILPYFRCDKCNVETDIIESEAFEDGAKKQLSEKIEGNYIGRIRGEDKVFDGYGDCEFEYDARDWYFIPGLCRPHGEGFLTPVFFTVDLLLHYNNHSDYKVVMKSNSRVSILKNGESLISHGMGINRNGLLFAWLGDLYNELFEENEKDYKRFLLSNVDSDHDIVSDYYLSEIEIYYTECDNELRIFKLHNELNLLVKNKFGYELTTFDIDLLKHNYKFPILNEFDQIFNSYLALTKLIIETINLGNLRNILLKNGSTEEKLNDLGSLKLLSLILEKVMEYPNTFELMTPFFVLYDLRLLQGHFSDTSFNEKYKYCQKRLNVSTDTNYLDTFGELVKALIKSHETLISVLKSYTS